MTRIADILVRCRDSLSDEDGSRWSDDRLVRLIDEAQKKIAYKNQLLRKTVIVPVISEQFTYELPSDAFLLTRVTNELGDNLAIKSHAAMDDTESSTWELDTGAVIDTVVFDNQNPGVFRIFPIIEVVTPGEIFIIDDFGVATNIVASITGTGTDTSLFTSNFGFLTSMATVVESLKIYYRAKPTTVTLAIDLLEIDPTWDIAIKHYVVGMALHDDQDTQNRQISTDELALYAAEMLDAKKTSSKDNISRSVVRTRYNSEI